MTVKKGRCTEIPAESRRPFPPAPWRLVGDGHAGVWRVPVQELPRWRLPHGVRPLVVRRRATLVAFWVDYRPGGVLAYRELLVALVVTHRCRIAATAVAAWVDDERSLHGGRELWGIPKESATFDFDTRGGDLRARMTAVDGDAVSAVHHRGVRLPGRLPVRARLVQDVDGETVRVPLRVTGRAYVGRARLSAEERGPLGFLRGRRPVAALALGDFRFTVGGAEPAGS